MKLNIFFLFVPFFLFSQGYTSYFTGNTTNITTTPEFGVCMMGGATEHDNAMKWLLQKANGGDVVVLRSSGSNGYNNYLYSELGIPVNSVETLVITSVEGATNPYVLDKVANAEMIWFAGGDQWNYVSYFKDNALEDVLNNHINVKHAPIGGTSAGMAILGGNYFSAQNGTVTSTQAMSNPYASNVTLGGYSGTILPQGDFINIPLIGNVITDTHFDNPDRRGRIATFIARYKKDVGTTVNGIACNEYTAVCIGTDGIAHVYGDYPNYQEFAYFIQANCELWNTIENCQSGQPLTWNSEGEAFKVYKVPGTMNGTNFFDVNNWMLGSNFGGSWEHWSVNNGVFAAVAGTPQSCVLNADNFEKDNISVYPNPFSSQINIQNVSNFDIEMIDVIGEKVIEIKNYATNTINTTHLEKGIYFMRISKNNEVKFFKVIKK